MNRLFGVALAGPAGLSQAQGTAAPYPAKPVTIISPFAPGGSTDKDGRNHALEAPGTGIQHQGWRGLTGTMRNRPYPQAAPMLR